MKAILIACITVAVIAVVGSVVLGNVQVSAEQGFTDHVSARV